MEPYKIYTEVFEGPLDLLLSLIEKRKLLINDIALANVADDFLKYLEQHPEFPIQETAQFVLVGSTLLFIKSKSLLPVLSLTNEEQHSIEDLETRLKILERYQTYGRSLVERFNTSPLFARRYVRRIEPKFTPLSDMTIVSLDDAMNRVLLNLPETKPELAEATVRKVISLEDTMEQLTNRISSSMSVSFRQFTSSVPEGRVNMIVTFLAMLELVRQGVIRVEQESNYSDITMQSDLLEVPKYG